MQNMAGGPVVEGGISPFFPVERMNLAQLFFNAAVYGYVLSEASNLISDGSEFLLLVPRLAPVVGSIVLPVLGAVPDGMMVMFSGLGDDAQNQVSVGIGALAGSTVMLLTLPWFIAVYCGRVNIKNGDCTYRAPKDQADGFEKLTEKDSVMQTLRETGVGISDELQSNAKIMLYSIFGYCIVQVPAFFVDSMKPVDIAADALVADHRKEAGYEANFALLGLVVCMVEFVLYLKIQWESSGDEGGRVEEKISQKHVEAMNRGTITLGGAIAQFRKESNFASMLEGGKDDVTVHLKDEAKQARVRRFCQILAPFFAVYDLNGDNSIDFDEFRMIFKDIRGNVSRKTLQNIFKAADVSEEGAIGFEEFAACIMSFAFYPDGTLEDEDELGKGTVANPRRLSGVKASRVVPKIDLDMVPGSEAEEVEKDEDDEDDDGEEEEDMPEEFRELDPQEQQRKILLRAGSMMGLGTVLVLLFSDPMVNVMNEMGIRLNISPFYISFLLAPMASNASEMVSAYNYAKRRTQKSINTALSTLEGAAVMNNTFVLGVFYALIYVKGLAWEFTAETISIVLIQFLIGAMVLTRRSMTLLDALLILSCYGFAMALVAILEAMGID